MPSRNLQNRIQDILSAIKEIESFIDNMTFEQFQADSKTVRAVLYDIAIIGEVARSINPEVELIDSGIPWADIYGMRNIVIHEYFQVNLQIVWQTIQEDLIPLSASLSELLERLE